MHFLLYIHQSFFPEPFALFSISGLGFNPLIFYYFCKKIISVRSEVTSQKYTVFYKQSIFDPRPENCLSFSKKSPQKIV